MGYQALLFCPDEKTARVVTQILSELEFTVLACAEPPSALKHLTERHFDAIVVDCDNNEENAKLLFESAHHAAGNQAALAVAMVEAQAELAKAFRIGANLVLTKPLNVEQAKGTLRVARGLLRKSAAAKAATAGAAKTAGVTDAEMAAAISSDAATTLPTEPAAPMAQGQDHGQGQGQGAAASASVAIEFSETETATLDAREKAATPEIATPTAPAHSAGSGMGAAAAPALAREPQNPVETVAPIAKNIAIEKSAAKPTAEPPKPALKAASKVGSARPASGSSKKTTLAVATVVLVAAGGYLAWSQWQQLGRSNATTAPAGIAAQSLAASPAVPVKPSVAPEGKLSGLTAAATSDNPSTSGYASPATASTAPVPQTVNVSPDVAQALLLTKAEPEYPANAQPGLEGAVQLSATISPSGDVSSVKTVSGDPMLAQAAAQAVKQWKYKPYVMHGTPNAFQTLVTVNFKAPK
jgi:TonB family protein